MALQCYDKKYIWHCPRFHVPFGEGTSLFIYFTLFYLFTFFIIIYYFTYIIYPWFPETMSVKPEIDFTLLTTF